MKIDANLSPCKKLKSKWIKNLMVKPATLSLIEEKVGSILEHLDTGDHIYTMEYYTAEKK